MSVVHDPRLDDPLPEVDRQQLLAALRQVLPPDCILAQAEQQRPFECDAQPNYRVMPLLTVLPRETAQVQSVLRVCHELGVPVVTRGAGTGLSGGALPCASGVLLVLTRMDRVLQIDAANRLARVQPGVRNLAISDAARPHGLYYAPDPSSQLACSIGGNVAENAGGVHCLKYGLTVHNVRSVEAFTVSGEAITVHACDEGAGLLPLLIGSEGMLAVVVEITVDLLVIPPVVETLLAAFDSVAAAGEAVAGIIAAGVIPAGLEMMDSLAVSAAEDFVGAGYPRDAAAILLVELDGCESEVAAELQRSRQVLRASGATAIRQAASAAERELLWKGRKAAFPAVGRLAPDYYCMDGTIPRRAIGEVLQHISELSHEYAMPVANVFHAGDGNLHPLILFDANVPGALAQAEEFGAGILEKSVAVGGAITGEHGVGREKINQMACQFSDGEIRQLQRIKLALDPDGLLNPGKNIPTLKRCQEYRAVRSS